MVDAGEYSFTVEQINEMKEAADENQLKFINTFFPELKSKSIYDLLLEAQGINKEDRKLRKSLERYIRDNK